MNENELRERNRSSPLIIGRGFGSQTWIFEKFS